MRRPHIPVRKDYSKPNGLVISFGSAVADATGGVDLGLFHALKRMATFTVPLRGNLGDDAASSEPLRLRFHP